MATCEFTSDPPVIPTAQTTAPPHLFRPFVSRELRLRNRIVMSPMCQYSCEERDGLATDWHFVHLATRAVGGAGLVMTEAAAVSPEGRITPQDVGIWSDPHAQALARFIPLAKRQGAAVGVQLSHAGRKASTNRPWEGRTALSDADGGWQPLGPTALAYSDSTRTPTAMSKQDINRVVDDFASAARRARAVGFDLIEIHAAHGYLLHSFYSPLSNTRTDEYGGSFPNRIRLLLEVVDAVRREWPLSKPLFVRISATDWLEGGWREDDSVLLATQLAAHGVDVIDCSTAGNAPTDGAIPIEPGYQVDFARVIRHQANVPVAAVGLITSPSQAEEIIAQGKADLIFLGREMLRNPYFPLWAAATLAAPEAITWPVQYQRSQPSGHVPHGGDVPGTVCGVVVT